MYLICDIGFILEHELLKIVLQIQAVERVAGIQKCFLLFDMTRIIYTMTAVEKDSHQVLWCDGLTPAVLSVLELCSKSYVTIT